MPLGMDEIEFEDLTVYEVEKSLDGFTPAPKETLDPVNEPGDDEADNERE